MKRKLSLLIFLLACLITGVHAISADSTQVSLLTVMPRPNKIYTMFGHTAIRFNNPAEKMDLVFNYGTFDFDKPNFLYLFLKGETDYSISADDYNSFYLHYLRENSTVIEQVLDIPTNEKQKMIRMLFENMRPENREYRYNYFFDNCSTRPRDIIERFAGGSITYPEADKGTTFRKLVYGCTSAYPWMTFGIDLLIGNGADSIIGRRYEMFLPEKLMSGLDDASIINDSLQKRPIVIAKQELYHSAPDKEAGGGALWSSPMIIGAILAILCIAVSIFGFFLKKSFRFFFCILFLTAGLAGCIVAFIALVSLHPCTWPNWNLLWIHPLHLIPFVGYLFKKTYPFICWYHWSNFVILSSLLLGWTFIPQELNPACIPFILCLWISSGYTLFYENKIRA